MALLVDDLDVLFRDCCGIGENLVFAVHYSAGLYPRVKIISMRVSGLGIIAKVRHHVYELGKVRLLQGRDIRTVSLDARILFLGVAPKGEMAGFRRYWAHRFGSSHFGMQHRFKASAQGKVIQFSLEFEVEGLQIIDVVYDQPFENLLDSVASLRLAMLANTEPKLGSLFND
jgi:hypothetical protein